MAKQQSLHRVKMYDPSTYRSVEQKVMGALEPVGKSVVDFGSYAIRSAYGVISIPLRIPTFVRKTYNSQILPNKIDRKVDREGITTPQLGGFLVGAMGGAVADFFLLDYVIGKAFEGNYIPLIALGATNLASTLYELGRLKTSRKEYLGLQKYKEWKQKKKEEKEEKEAKKKKTKSGGFVE